MGKADFQTPAAYTQFRRDLAKFRKNVNPEVYAQVQAILTSGRDNVGWRETGREILGGARNG